MYVYWWHVGELGAVKIGHAADPIQHVSEYRREHGLDGEDVHGYDLDRGTDAAWVESQLCRFLESKGLRRFTLRLGEGEEEFFSLGNSTFAEAHGLLRHAAHHIALADVSNQRKQQRRDEFQVAQVATPCQPEETTYGHGELCPGEHPTTAPSPFSVSGRLWRYLIGAIVVGGLVIGLRGGDLMPGPRSANLAEQKGPPVTTASQDGESSPKPPHDKSCTLVELGDTLVHVNCDRSWAWMRWDKRWVFASGRNENDALEFFNASDVARRDVALPSGEPVPRLSEPAEAKPERFGPSNQPPEPAPPPQQSRPLQDAPRPATAPPSAPQRPEQAEVKPERLPQSNQPAARPAPSPQLPPRQEPPTSVTALPQPPPRREAAPPREQCTVSRPKPGFQVYLVTCPNSQAMIGRTVDSATGWTVAESVNATEAIEFFMKSPYAR